MVVQSNLDCTTEERLISHFLADYRCVVYYCLGTDAINWVQLRYLARSSSVVENQGVRSLRLGCRCRTEDGKLQMENCRFKTADGKLQ